MKNSRYSRVSTNYVCFILLVFVFTFHVSLLSFILIVFVFSFHVALLLRMRM